VRNTTRALVLGLLMASTAHRAPAQVAPRPVPPPAADTAMDVRLPLRPQASWPPIWFPEFDEVARTAGLRPLREDTIAGGLREVRAWIGGSLGYPRTLYRLRMAGGRVEGALYHYWAMDRDPSEPDSTSYETLIRRRMQGPCGPIETGAEVEVCGGLFTGEPDWPGILAEAEAAGLWSLPDESTLPSAGLVLDGWTVVVELRDGSEYRAYEYASPSAAKGPEQANALRIATAFSRALEASRPPEVVRRYRGLLRTGPSLHELRPCASSETWELNGDLRGFDHGWTGAPRADTATAGVRQHYVEVEGELAPAWLARRWKSPYPRVLHAQRVIEAREWTADACAGADPPEIIP
jgi:hypothetical protein